MNTAPDANDSPQHPLPTAAYLHVAEHAEPYAYAAWRGLLRLVLLYAALLSWLADVHYIQMSLRLLASALISENPSFATSDRGVRITQLSSAAHRSYYPSIWTAARSMFTRGPAAAFNHADRICTNDAQGKCSMLA